MIWSDLFGEDFDFAAVLYQLSLAQIVNAVTGHFVFDSLAPELPKQQMQPPVYVTFE